MLIEKRIENMPLGFNSLSHGTVAFGFFNIESDLLLLDRYFLFSTEFCQYISNFAEINEERDFKALWQVYLIADPEQIGNLMDAINGTQYTGFIGEVYRQFPFPESPADFKQDPTGVENRNIVEDIIKRYAKCIEIPFVVDGTRQTTEIGDYLFERQSFLELIKYVWRGGYPRWKDEIKPPYLLEMQWKIGKSGNSVFKNIVFD